MRDKILSFIFSGVTRIWCGGRGGGKSTWNFLSHKMTQIHWTRFLKNVHVATTDLPRLPSQNTNMFEEAAHRVAVRLSTTEKNK